MIFTMFCIGNYQKTKNTKNYVTHYLYHLDLKVTLAIINIDALLILRVNFILFIHLILYFFIAI